MAMDQEMLRQYIAQMLAQVGQGAATYDKKGNEDPYSLDYQKSLANYQQDQFDLFGDPVLTALSGGQGTFDPAAYQDVQNGSDTYAVPSNPLDAYASLDPSSEEGTIARLVAQGYSPGEIAAEFANKGYKNDQNDKALDRVRGTANDLFKGQHEYQSQMQQLPGFSKGEDGSWQYEGDGQVQGGKLTVPKMERSTAAAAFDKMGLPTPDQTFGAQDFGFNADERNARQDAQLTQLAELRGQAGALKNAWQGQQETDRQAEMRARTAPPESRLTPQELSARDAYVSPLNRTGNEVAVPDAHTLEMRRQLDLLLNTARTPMKTKGYREYADAKTKASKAGRQAQQDEYGRRNAERYATGLADTHTAVGLTPLTMIALKRAQALRSLGG